MDDLYVENFFQHPQQIAPTAPAASTAAAITEDSISQIHFYLRVLKEEIYKQLQETPPFPLTMQKLEKAILAQKNDEAFAVLDDLEEFLDLQFVTNG